MKDAGGCSDVLTVKLLPGETLLWSGQTIPNMSRALIAFVISAIAVPIAVHWLAIRIAADPVPYLLILMILVLLLFGTGYVLCEAWLARRGKVRICIGLTDRRLMRMSNFVGRSFQSLDYLLSQVEYKRGIIFVRTGGTFRHQRLVQISMSDSDAATVYELIVGPRSDLSPETAGSSDSVGLGMHDHRLGPLRLLLRNRERQPRP